MVVEFWNNEGLMFVLLVFSIWCLLGSALNTLLTALCTLSDCGWIKVSHKYYIYSVILMTNMQNLKTFVKSGK